MGNWANQLLQLFQISESFGWHLQYLTIIGIMISSLCFTSGLLADMTHSHTLFTIKNYLALVAAPIEVLISLLYWSLRFIDQSFVVPPDLPMLPIASDVGFHLAPAILLTVDALFLSPPWPSQPINPSASLITFMTSTALAFLYWFWIELCYSRNGFYPYPIFALLSTLQRIILFAGSGVAMWAIGVGLRWAYCTINGVEDIIYTAQKKVE
ncbi:hypothetical protein CC80DRAFT_133581 [Byssothecium circinans]|uniref:FAR-17a/AIG1-like protein n=1 Tax=Byssothecium circinans TaxID=147558 RepID=A0A6A5TYA9_9PLEO|nr:hypothetical protein CC80DRAFT_133581 [Byssothecium circinans]